MLKGEACEGALGSTVRGRGADYTCGEEGAVQGPEVCTWGVQCYK